MCQAQLLMFALAQVEREGDLKLPRAAAEPELGVFLVWQGDSQNKGVCPQNPAHPARPASCSPWTLLWAGSEQVRQVVSPVKPQFLHLSKKKKKASEGYEVSKQFNLMCLQWLSPCPGLLGGCGEDSKVDRCLLSWILPSRVFLYPHPFSLLVREELPA